MQTVRIEQKINLSTQRSLSSNPKGHATMTVVAEVDTDDQTLIGLLKDSILTLNYSTSYHDVTAVNNRVLTLFSDIVGDTIIMAHHVPKVTEEVK